jgi:hypothetical protein
MRAELPEYSLAPGKDSGTSPLKSNIRTALAAKPLACRRLLGAGEVSQQGNDRIIGFCVDACRKKGAIVTGALLNGWLSYEASPKK